MSVSADAVGQASLCAPMPLANVLWPHTDLIHHLTGMTERPKLVRGGLLISLRARLEVCVLVQDDVFNSNFNIWEVPVRQNKQSQVTTVMLNH